MPKPWMVLTRPRGVFHGMFRGGVLMPWWTVEAASTPRSRKYPSDSRGLIFSDGPDSDLCLEGIFSSCDGVSMVCDDATYAILRRWLLMCMLLLWLNFVLILVLFSHQHLTTATITWRFATASTVRQRSWLLLVFVHRYWRRVVDFTSSTLHISLVSIRRLPRRHSRRLCRIWSAMRRRR